MIKIQMAIMKMIALMVIADLFFNPAGSDYLLLSSSEEPLITPPLNLDSSQQQSDIDTENNYEERDIDTTEDEQCKAFYTEGCGCSSSCSTKFPQQYIREVRNEMAELSKDELDIFIMGHLASNLHIEERTLANKRVPKVREKPSTAYYHRGVRVINLLLDPSKVHDCSYPTTDLPENIHVPSWNREVSLGCPENELSKKWNSDKVTFISN